MSGEPLAPVLAPLDVRESASLEGTVVRVGGRLSRAGADWRVADAFAAIELSPAAGASAAFAEGCLAIVEGTLRAGRIEGAQASFVQAPLAPALSEFERVAASGLAERLKLRARLLAATRRFFEQRGFLEVDTPIRVVECCPEVQIDPIASEGRYLVTSPELHMKRLLVGGVPRLFQLVHCFRADELGALHAPEFMLLEWYRAFAGVEAVMADTETLVASLCREFRGASELALAGGRAVDVTPPFERITVREAFQRFAGVADACELALKDEDAYFQALVDAVEPGLARAPRPVFLCEYPASQAALARLKPGDPSVAERFELYVAGVELCNGYGELSDPREQRARLERDRAVRLACGRSEPTLPVSFLAALEQGMPPAAGNALGMERLMMLLAGEPTIARMNAFPEG